MAQTFTALTLSGSSNGQPIKINATATAGTTIHTATASTTQDSVDEVYLWAGSTSTAAINGTLHIGTVTNDGQSINFRVPAAYSGPVCILAGHRLFNGQIITATVSVAERVNIFGNVNRISLQSS